MQNQNIKIAVDAIVFGYEEGKLYLLLIQPRYGDWGDKWALPGGFVLEDEPLTTAVKRELKEEANVEVNYLEQLYTFGDDINRDPRARVISVAYFALVNPTQMTLKAATDANDARWFEYNDLPSLAYDHQTIIAKAYQRLQAKVTYQPIGFDLLDKEFPFSDVENLYRTILGQEIDRRNFRKKIMSFGIIEETNKIQKSGGGRPAKLFRFNLPKYKELSNSRFHLEIKFA